MCGIAGYCGYTTNSEQQIRKMCDQIASRGPDASGYWSDDNGLITLGHRRLSIIDLTENGSQPMHSASGRYVIVYNGEIYNFDILRKKLISENKITSFRGSSDTEVLLEAFEAYGLDAIKWAKGMFAIALYDRKEKTLHLMRDRTGEKPLYYGIVNGCFSFASDLASLKIMDGFHNQINATALQAYFQYKSVPQPLSIYEGIYKLLPGYILSIKQPFDTASFTQYWSYEEAIQNGIAHPFSGSFEEAVSQMDVLLKDAVKGQMIADVPLGAFLSGGIDSPLVVSAMQQQSATPVKTFTIGFEDRDCNEADYAKDIAKHLGTDHTELYVTQRELKDVIPLLPKILSEPLADPACLPNYLVSKMARSSVTVTLSGDGGDELFCGYGIYNRLNKIEETFSKIPTIIRQTTASISQHTPLRNYDRFYNLGKYCGASNIFDFHTLFRTEHSLLSDTITNQPLLTYDALLRAQNIKSGSLLPDLSRFRRMDVLNQLDSRSQMLFLDQTGFMTDTVLNKVDRTGMAVSLENRIPLLDRDIIEFSWTLPIKFKSDQGIDKRLLKELLYRYVPKSLLDRPKHGFEVPLNNWLSKNGELYEWAQELIYNSKLAADGYLNKSVILSVWNHFLTHHKYTLLVWYILQAEAWYQEQIGGVDTL